MESSCIEPIDLVALMNDRVPMRAHVEGVLWVLAVGLPILAAWSRPGPFLLSIGILWIGAITVVVPLHFYKAWQRLRTVQSKREYAAWVGAETFITIVLIGLSIYAAFSK